MLRKNEKKAICTLRKNHTDQNSVCGTKSRGPKLLLAHTANTQASPMNPARASTAPSNRLSYDGPGFDLWRLDGPDHSNRRLTSKITVISTFVAQ